MTCACGNDARYINEHGALCCGTCPIRDGIDSIRFADVAPLLARVREFIEYLGDEDVDPYWVDHHVKELRAIIGRKP